MFVPAGVERVIFGHMDGVTLRMAIAIGWTTLDHLPLTGSRGWSEGDVVRKELAEAHGQMSVGRWIVEIPMDYH